MLIGPFALSRHFPSRSFLRWDFSMSACPSAEVYLFRNDIRQNLFSFGEILIRILCAFLFMLPFNLLLCRSNHSGNNGSSGSLPSSGGGGANGGVSSLNSDETNNGEYLNNNNNSLDNNNGKHEHVFSIVKLLNKLSILTLATRTERNQSSSPNRRAK